MLNNPVFRREMTVGSRSMRLSLVITAFNLILAVFALISMAAIIGEARHTARISYASFLVIFRYVAVIEFVLLLVITPALTAGSISGERERRTLDLMLTTRLTPAGIVTGKLEASLSSVLLLMFSSLPVFALAMSYGGITPADILLLLLAYLTAAVLTAGVGIFVSASGSRSTFATTAAYGMTAVLTAGLPALAYLLERLSGGAGLWSRLLLLDPAASFYALICSMTGGSGAIRSAAQSLGLGPSYGTMRWFAASTALQLAAGTVLTALAVRRVSPAGRRHVPK